MAFIPFQQAKEAFTKALPQTNLQLLAFIEQRVNTLAKKFDSLSQTDLTKIETELAASLRQLGVLQAEAETKADFIKDQLDAKWKELISEMKENDPKTSLRDIEAEFNNRFMNERINYTFWKGQAKNYSNQLNAINSILLAITHRLKELSRLEKKASPPKTTSELTQISQSSTSEEPPVSFT